MNLVKRKSFPKLSNFARYFTQLGKFWGEANDEKHADPGKKNRNSRKSRENSQNLLEAFLTSRKEENLYGHCDMNNARRILSKGSTPLRGCWFWLKKLLFQKNFGRNFIAVEGVTCEFWKFLAFWKSFQSQGALKTVLRPALTKLFPSPRQRDNVVYWKTKRKIKDDLQ